MRLTTQLLCMAWIASISSLLCLSIPLEKSTDVVQSDAYIYSPTVTDPANEDKPSKEELEESVEGEHGEEEEEEEDGDEENDTGSDEPHTEPFIDFDDSDDVDALAKGILGSNDKKESVVPCFGTWWPSTGGYVYYYDYGPGNRPSEGDSDEYEDSTPRRRSRRTRRRRRMRRNRTRRARTSQRSAKKKT